MKAFPLKAVNKFDDCEGMDLRDYFAAKVLSGISSVTGIDFGTVDDVAITCYRLADAMMKAREDES